MVQIIFNNKITQEFAHNKIEELSQAISKATHLHDDEFYLEQSGKRLTACGVITNLHAPIYCRLRVCGGKGGFGSMLRAIGAQIEKTTNREACRDLSGRRLRDINEEKRLKAWLEKQADREREAEERKKRKIEKLLAVPKHDFKDAEYEETRSKLTEKVNDAVEEGFKKAMEKEKQNDDKPTSSHNLKRKPHEAVGKQVKKKKPALWIGDDISDGSTDSSDEDDESEIDEQKTKQTIQSQEDESDAEETKIQQETRNTNDNSESMEGKDKSKQASQIEEDNSVDVADKGKQAIEA